MDLPVELVQLLQHAGIEGQKLTWDLQVNSNTVSVKLVWIKAGKPGSNFVGLGSEPVYVHFVSVDHSLFFVDTVGILMA
jgi:hypothetical protein